MKLLSLLPFVSKEEHRSVKERNIELLKRIGLSRAELLSSIDEKKVLTNQLTAANKLVAIMDQKRLIMKKELNKYKFIGLPLVMFIGVAVGYLVR